MAKKVATRGPAPKRQAVSAKNRTVEERPDTVVMSGVVKPPPASASWDPLARAWYRALAKSGPSRLFEPSDWAAARLAAEVITRMLADRTVNGALLGQVQKLMAGLGTTEGDRRRLRIEVERAAEATLASVSSLEDQRKRLTGD